EWVCGWITAADMGEHLRNTCQLRNIPCKDGCGQSIVAREAELHYQGGCIKRLINCTLGCGASVTQE
ncbi:unnamed protein product, partial [Choristocarpus tenellus]